MNHNGLTPSTWPSSRHHAFTLVELLVVVGVIAILASFLMPMLLKTFIIGQQTRCVSNLGQLTRTCIAYTKDYGELLLSGGNRDGKHDWNTSGYGGTDAGPIGDGPWDRWRNRDVKDMFLYQALQPYTSPAATMKAASDAYKKRTGTTYDPSTTNVTQRDILRNELAGLVKLYTCPAKQQANVGYGFNYAAVYGVSGIFDWNLGSDGGNGNPFFPNFRWRSANVSNGLMEARAAPVMRYIDPDYRPVRQPVPVLWYGQNIPSAALVTPSRTVAFCDTGWVTNDADPVNNPTAADKWLENDTSNTTGYVRFPLDKGVNSQAYINGAKYKSTKPWRPVPRHKGRTTVGNFDGSAARIAIQDIVGYAYGDARCLYGNRPKKEPPLSPYQGSY